MDRFQIASEPGKGTIVALGQILPRRAGALTRRDARRRDARSGRAAGGRSARARCATRTASCCKAWKRFGAARKRPRSSIASSSDTNRGVVALYAELDERAEQLRQASELKSRFLSNMSHEFRTPLNSIMALSRLLLDRIDGDLNPEQEKQVGYIRRSAEGLLELVNDLLDLAKVEAGKVEVKPVPFLGDGAVRRVARRVAAAAGKCGGRSDFRIRPRHSRAVHRRGKVAQILRNLISNALKFTEAGEVRVSAAFEPQ